MSTWTNARIFKFIELYRKEGCIWNPKHKHHKDKVKNSDAWIRIANEMGETVTEVKRKKETLMAAFRLNHKRVMTSRRTATEENEIFKPIWIFYDALAAFMGNIYESRKYVQSSENNDQCEEFLVEFKSQSPNISEASDESSVKEKNSFLSTPQNSIPVRNEQENDAKIIKNALSKLNNVIGENKNQKQVYEEDECELYGRLLTQKLRQYPEPVRQELMYEIDGILIRKRRALDSGSSSHHKMYVSSPSQTNSASASTSQSNFPDRALYIVSSGDNDPLT